jgi:uncharacterized protein
VRELIGNVTALRSLRPGDFTDDRFGLPTVTDILRELEKPGRDPRPAFKTAAFAEEVQAIADLAPGMALEGVVTNVAAFGAFVDIGVHQDGLVHVSELSRDFVSDPRQVVKPGDIVKVTVLSVDIARKRISLTMRGEPGSRGGGREDAGGRRDGRDGGGRGGARGGGRGADRDGMRDGAMVQALRRAGLAGPGTGRT